MSVSLPVIVGYGGYNAAGRSSSHQAFRRMIIESLPENQQQQTVVSLACLMGLVKASGQGYETSDGQILDATKVDQEFRNTVLSGTLVRKITLSPTSINLSSLSTFPARSISVFLRSIISEFIDSLVLRRCRSISALRKSKSVSNCVRYSISVSISFDCDSDGCVFFIYLRLKSTQFRN